MTTSSSVGDWVMWFGTVQKLPLREQLRAAALAGCRTLSIGIHEYLGHLSHGISTRDMKKMAADAGVALTHIDPFVRWVPRWEPDEALGAPLNVLSYDEDDFFRIADALEAKSVSVVGAFPGGSVGVNELIDCFGRFCARAGQHGLRCDLEFVPFLGVTDLATAWKIVSAVNAPNSGVLFDFWHYNRGRQDDELLRSIPGRWITSVQFDDGDKELQPGISVVQDTLTRRQPPGEGQFRIRDIVAILREIGGLNNIGPEIYSAAFETMSAEEIAAKCRASMMWALEEK
jgi:4-hydroxyphenylpyruvate dioxygenase